MRKILSAVLVLVMAFSLTACSKEKNTSSDVNISTTQGQVENNYALNTTTSENEDSSTVVTSQESIPEETSKPESIPNNTQTSSAVSNPTVNVPKTFSPKVIASQCTHNYLPPTCTSFMPCTICGEHLKGLYQGQKIEYGHLYDSNKCVDCGFERKGTIELNLDYYALNQPITVDIYLTTTEEEIEIYPCVTLYKNVNGSWQPYNGMYEVGEFFALDATYGEVLESNGVKYGRWDYMNNNILKTNPNAIIEKDFANSRLIRRFKISFSELGEYKLDVTNGPNDSKKIENKNYDFMFQTY